MSEREIQEERRSSECAACYIVLLCIGSEIRLVYRDVRVPEVPQVVPGQVPHLAGI